MGKILQIYWNKKKKKKILSAFTYIFTHLEYFTLIHYILLLSNKPHVVTKHAMGFLKQ